MANQRQYESMVWNHLYVELGEAYRKRYILSDFVGPPPSTHAQKARFDAAYAKVRSQMKRFAGPEEELL